VVNVGAGTGSYEPPDRDVVAVEPSTVMRAQRAAGAARCVAARAEALPFADGAFDAAMAVLSDHHWSDHAAGLRELARVAPRVVLFTWENAVAGDFWLVRDHLPEFADYARRPSLAARVREALGPGVTLTPVPIPGDCADGFFHAHWRRPEAYLREDVRRATSVWARCGPGAEARAVGSLADALASGAWHERHGELLERDACELGARLVVRETG